jgi:protein ImuA
MATTACAQRPVPELERLRRTLAAAEAANGLADELGASITLGIPGVDHILGGGLSCSMLHEIAAVGESVITAATGFALALAARRSMPRVCAKGGALSALPAGRTVLWIAEDLSLAENGLPYGPGLDEAGIVPEQLIRVATARGRDVLWAMEEAMQCRAVGVVIGELRASSIDQVATRRLSLAAASGNTLGLILRTAPDKAPSAAATRWIIGTMPAVASSSARTGKRWDIGPPRLTARLVRNRRGRLGAWIVEWNRVEQRFELATNSEPVAGAAFNRPHYAVA